MNKRIVITGLGVIAPNGIGKENFWDALKEGRSGIKPVKRFDTNALKCSQAAEIQDFNPEEFLGKKGLRDLDRSSRLLCSAAGMAIEDAGLAIDYTNTNDIGVCTGTTLSSLWNYAEFDKEVIKEGPLSGLTQVERQLVIHGKLLSLGRRKLFPVSAQRTSGDFIIIKNIFDGFPNFPLELIFIGLIRVLGGVHYFQRTVYGIPNHIDGLCIICCGYGNSYH